MASRLEEELVMEQLTGTGRTPEPWNKEKPCRPKRSLKLKEISAVPLRLQTGDSACDLAFLISPLVASCALTI
jgi:hypothetical protein